jgi:hypothetical protein
MPSFQELFAQHVAAAMARQLALADLLGDRDWQIDMSAGVVTFGSDLRFPIQLLGSESHRDGTWLWAWATNQSNLPPALLQLCGWLRDFGVRNGVPELIEPGFPLERADGHRLALVASGLTGRPYYRGPYEGGALFFHLENVPDAPVPPERAVTVLGQVIQSFEVDHRATVHGFFQQQGWPLEPTPDGLIARHPDGSTVRIAFDQLGRIAKFDAQIQPR